MTASDPRGRGEDHDENIYVLAKEAASRSAAAPRAAVHSAPADPGRVSSAHRPPAPRRGSHHDSRQFESIMNPVTGIRDAQRRAGIKPVDHARNNRAAVREQSQINALRKMNPKPEAPRRKAGLIPLAVLHDRAGKEKAEDVGRAAGAGERDFVRENARRSAEAGPKPQACAAGGEAAGQWLSKADYGRVPKYLLDRKLQLAEQRQAEEAAKKAALIPPGGLPVSAEVACSCRARRRTKARVNAWVVEAGQGSTRLAGIHKIRHDWGSWQSGLFQEVWDAGAALAVRCLRAATGP